MAAAAVAAQLGEDGYDLVAEVDGERVGEAGDGNFKFSGFAVDGSGDNDVAIGFGDGKSGLIDGEHIGIGDGPCGIAGDVDKCTVFVDGSGDQLLTGVTAADSNLAFGGGADIDADNASVGRIEQQQQRPENCEGFEAVHGVFSHLEGNADVLSGWGWLSRGRLWSSGSNEEFERSDRLDIVETICFGAGVKP